LFYTSIKRPGRFEVGRSQPDEGQKMTMWKRNCFFGFCQRYGPYYNHR